MHYKLSIKIMSIFYKLLCKFNPIIIKTQIEVFTEFDNPTKNAYGRIKGQE